MLNGSSQSGEDYSLTASTGLRRHILWVDDDTSSSRRVDNTSSQSPLPNRTTTTTTSSSSAHFDAELPMCPDMQQYINQTENVRIASELRRWIGEPEYVNATKLPQENVMPRALFSALDDIQRQLILGGGSSDIALLKAKFPKIKKKLRGRKVEGKAIINHPHPVEVFQPKQGSRDDSRYAALFEELRRRDDTFYVVSFNAADHLMWPAMAHNKTNRPKMSLMFPAFGLNDSRMPGTGNDHITMMQIDCEVLDTSLIQVKEKLIPDHLRKYQNTTTTAAPVNNDADDDEGGRDEKGDRQFGPQLMERSSSGSVRRGLVREPYFVNSKKLYNGSIGDRKAAGLAWLN